MAERCFWCGQVHADGEGCKSRLPPASVAVLNPPLPDLRWSDGTKAAERGEDLASVAQTLTSEVLKEQFDERLQPGWQEQAAAAKASPAEGETRSIAIKELHASPTNPRQHFDDAALKKLAESIKHVGVLENLIVRPRVKGKDRGYEIVAGERRFRAAKLAKLPDLKCTIVDITDAEVLEIQLIENLEREDLNAIEEGVAFQQLCGSGGFTQEALGKRLGFSQGHIANRIRLLELPEDWRKRIISQEIPPTHARALLPWAKYPPILATFSKRLKEWTRNQGSPGVQDFGEIVLDAVHEATRPLIDDRVHGGDYQFVKIELKPTPEQAGELQLVDVPSNGWKGPEKRCVNVKAWEGLWKPLKDAALKKSKSRREQKHAVKDPAKPLSRAEQKKRDQELAAQFNKRLYRWKIAWMQQQIAARIDLLGNDLLLKLLLYFAVQNNQPRSGEDYAASIAALDGAAKPFSRKLGSYLSECDAYRTLSTIQGEDAFRKVAIDALKQWVVCNVENFSSHAHAPDIEAIAGDVGVDIETEWRVDREFLLLHTTDQLEGLAREWNWSNIARKNLKRGELITQLLAAAQEEAACPQELVKLKPVKLL